MAQIIITSSLGDGMLQLGQVIYGGVSFQNYRNDPGNRPFSSDVNGTTISAYYTGNGYDHQTLYRGIIPFNLDLQSYNITSIDSVDLTLYRTGTGVAAGWSMDDYGVTHTLYIGIYKNITATGSYSETTWAALSSSFSFASRSLSSQGTNTTQSFSFKSNSLGALNLSGSNAIALVLDPDWGPFGNTPSNQQNTDNIVFYSRNYNSGSNAPALTINYTAQSTQVVATEPQVFFL